MSDTVIMDALKAFLKPIIAEALQEASPVADTVEPEEPAPVQETPENPDPGKYYTVEDVKRILHIGTTSVYNLFKRKKLTKLKVLGKTLVLREELDNAVEAQEVCRYKHGR